MFRRISNFFLQPYTNIFYCIGYHHRWQTKQSIPHNLLTATQDAWRSSGQQYPSSEEWAGIFR